MRPYQSGGSFGGMLLNDVGCDMECAQPIKADAVIGKRFSRSRLIKHIHRITIRYVVVRSKECHYRRNKRCANQGVIFIHVTGPPVCTNRRISETGAKQRKIISTPSRGIHRTSASTPPSRVHEGLHSHRQVSSEAHFPKTSCTHRPPWSQCDAHRTLCKTI